MSLEKFKKQKRSRDKKEKKSGKNKRPKAASVESEEPYDARTSIDQDHAQLDFEVAASGYESLEAEELLEPQTIEPNSTYSSVIGLARIFGKEHLWIEAEDDEEDNFQMSFPEPHLLTELSLKQQTAFLELCSRLAIRLCLSLKHLLKFLNEGLYSDRHYPAVSAEGLLRRGSRGQELSVNRALPANKQYSELPLWQEISRATRKVLKRCDSLIASAIPEQPTQETVSAKRFRDYFKEMLSAGVEGPIPPSSAGSAASVPFERTLEASDPPVRLPADAFEFVSLRGLTK